MRHLIVRRTALTLAAALGGCAVLFVPLVGPRPQATAAEPAPASGVALFEARCGSCHEFAALRQRVLSAGTSRPALDALLTHHGDASGEDARLILDAVTDRAAGPRPP